MKKRTVEKQGGGGGEHFRVVGGGRWPSDPMWEFESSQQAETLGHVQWWVLSWYRDMTEVENCQGQPQA